MKPLVIFFTIILFSCSNLDGTRETKELIAKTQEHLDEQDYENMIEPLERLIELNPDSSRYKITLIAVKLELGLTTVDEADEEYAKIPVSGLPYRVTNQFELGLHVARNDVSGAIEMLRKGIASDPNYFMYHYQLGEQLMIIEDFAGAIVEFEKCMKLEPMYKYAHAQRGLALYKMGRVSEACEQWKTPGGGSISYQESYCN